MRASHSRGTTYVEGLFVLVTLSIMAVISMPRFIRAQTHARQSEAITNLKSLHAAMSLQQTLPDSIHLSGFDPPRGNRYSYHLSDSCDSIENRDGPVAVQHSNDDCIGPDRFAYGVAAVPAKYSYYTMEDPRWDEQASEWFMGSHAGVYGYEDTWHYLAYAAGDVDSEYTGDLPFDHADTWLISSSDGDLYPICPTTATGDRVFAPAGEPFMIYDDTICN